MNKEHNSTNSVYVCFSSIKYTIKAKAILQQIYITDSELENKWLGRSDSLNKKFLQQDLFHSQTFIKKSTKGTAL